MKHMLLVLTVLLIISWPISAQTHKPSTQPDYDAILKKLTEQVESMERKLEESQKETTNILAAEKRARDAGLTARPDYVDPYLDYYLPFYYPRYRYYHQYYPRIVHSRSYYPRIYYPRYYRYFPRSRFRY